ncbi:hypothetical protein M9458_035219, partial [Cirrhinus mrigala]
YFINHVLALNNSKFYVDVEDSNPPPIRKHADAPVHHQPASSTCCSNELTPSVPPSLSPVLQSPSLILSPEPAAHSRTPAVTPRSSRPATAPRSYRLAATPRPSQATSAPRYWTQAYNMASHMCQEDLMDLMLPMGGNFSGHSP